MASDITGILGNLGQALNETSSIAGSAGIAIRNALSMDDIQKGIVTTNKQLYDLQRGLQGTAISANDVTKQFRAMASAFTNLEKANRGYNLSLEETTKLLNAFYSSVGGMSLVADKGAKSIGDLGKQLIKTFRDDAPGAAKNLMTVLEKLPVMQDAILKKSLSTSQMMTIYRQFGLEAMQFMQKWQAQTTPAMEQTQKLRDMFASLKAAGEQVKIKLQVDNTDQISAMIGSMKSGLKIAANIVAAPITAANAVSIAPGAAAVGLGAQATITMLPRILLRLWTSFNQLINALDRNTASQTGKSGSSIPGTAGVWTSQLSAPINAIGPAPTGLGFWGRMGAQLQQYRNGNIILGGSIYNRADMASALGQRAMGVAGIGSALAGAYIGSQVYSAGVRQRYLDIAEANGPSALTSGTRTMGMISGGGMGLLSGAGAGLAVGAVAGGPVGWAVGSIVAVGAAIYNISNSLKAFKEATEKARDSVKLLTKELDDIQTGYNKNWNKYFTGINSANEQSDLASGMLGQQRAYSEKATNKWYKDQLADSISTKGRENVENFLASHPEFAKVMASKDIKNSKLTMSQYQRYYDRMMNIAYEGREHPKFNGTIDAYLREVALNSLGDEAFSAIHAKQTGQPDWFKYRSDQSEKVNTINKLTTASIPALQSIYGQLNTLMQISQLGSGSAFGAEQTSEMGALTSFIGGRRYRYDTKVTGTWEGMVKITEEQVSVIKEQIKYQKELLKLETPGSVPYNQSIEAVNSLSGQLAQAIRQQIDIGIERTITRAQTKITTGKAGYETASIGAGVNWMGSMRGGGSPWTSMTSQMDIYLSGMKTQIEQYRDMVKNPDKYRLSEAKLEETKQKLAPMEVEYLRAALEKTLLPLRMRGEYLNTETGAQRAIFERIRQTTGFSTQGELASRQELIELAKQQTMWARKQYETLIKNGAPGGYQEQMQAYLTMIQSEQSLREQEYEQKKLPFEKGLMGLDYAESMRQLALTRQQVMYRPMSEQLPLQLEGLDILREKIKQFAGEMNLAAQDSPQWYEAANKLTSAQKEYYNQLDYIRNSWEQQLTEMSFNLPTGSYTMGQEGPSKYQLFGSGYYPYRNLFNSPAATGHGMGSYDMLYGGFMGAGLASLSGNNYMNQLISGNIYGGASNSTLSSDIVPYLGPMGAAQPGRNAASANLESIIKNDTNQYLKSIDTSLKSIANTGTYQHMMY